MIVQCAIVVHNTAHRHRPLWVYSALRGQQPPERSYLGSVSVSSSIVSKQDRSLAIFLRQMKGSCLRCLLLSCDMGWQSAWFARAFLCIWATCVNRTLQHWTRKEAFVLSSAIITAQAQMLSVRDHITSVEGGVMYDCSLCSILHFQSNLRSSFCHVN